MDNKTEVVKMETIQFHPIGIIRSPFKEAKGTPIQPTAEGSAGAQIDIYPEFREGLEDLEGFSHIILLYYFHRAGQYSLKVKPFLDNKEHGLFATRAPARPNAIGLSVVRLVSIQGNSVSVRDADILDGTPLLDIKPYVPDFDVRDNTKTGWFAPASGKHRNMKDDGRFLK